MFTALKKEGTLFTARGEQENSKTAIILHPKVNSGDKLPDLLPQTIREEHTQDVHIIYSIYIFSIRGVTMPDTYLFIPIPEKFHNSRLPTRYRGAKH